MNKIYKMSEQQPGQYSKCVLWEDHMKKVDCLYSSGSWYVLDEIDNVSVYKYYRCAYMTDLWMYAVDVQDSNETTPGIDDLCKRVEALEDKIKELEKHMTPPVTEPLTPYTPYPVTPINPYYPWPTTAPPYDPIIYRVTCSVS